MNDVIETFETAADGLERELSMLDAVSKGAKPRFLVWSATNRALTLPERYARNPAFASASKALSAEGWPVVTRRTGGGITPQGRGVINVAIAFSVPPKDARSVPDSYAAICDPLVAALQNMDVTARAGAVANSFCDGDYNLEVEGRKLVGTAQRWRGANVLCHALVLVDLDLPAAVSAAQMLADKLALDDTYRLDAHTMLAAHTGPTPELANTFAKHITEVLSAANLAKA